MATLTTTPATPRRGRTGPALALGLVTALVGLAGWQAWVNVAAWRNLREGRAALRRDDPADARRHLERCLETWPRSAEANYLAAQAARRDGDLKAAVSYLQEANRLGRPADDIEVEYALIKTRSGQFAEAESALLHHLHNGHPESPQILSAVVPQYMAQFRWGDAEELGTRWVQLCPESVPAWKAQAEIQERLRKKDAAADALRRVVALSPGDRQARSDLARLILEARQPPDEAAGHAEWLTQTDPSDAAAVVLLAACREAQSRTDEAVALLDRVIAGHPSAKAYHLRGRIALARDPATALPDLRRAAALDRSDPDVLYTLFVCLQRSGTAAEASDAEAKWRRASSDLQRVGDLGKAISAAPHDPDLRREMGELFLRNGRDTDGVRWLESALRERPDHAPTHAALAGYYDRVGHADRAAFHRAFLVSPPNLAKSP